MATYLLLYESSPDGRHASYHHAFREHRTNEILYIYTIAEWDSIVGSEYRCMTCDACQTVSDNAVHIH